MIVGVNPRHETEPNMTDYKTPRITTEFRVLLFEHLPTVKPGSPQDEPLSADSIKRVEAATASMPARWRRNFGLEFTGHDDKVFKFTKARGLLDHARTMPLDAQLSTAGNKIVQLLSEVNSQHGAPTVVRMRAMSVEPKPGPSASIGENAAMGNWQSY